MSLTPLLRRLGVGSRWSLADEAAQVAAGAIRATRAELIRLVRENEISDALMRHQKEILDYQEAQLPVDLPPMASPKLAP